MNGLYLTISLQRYLCCIILTGLILFFFSLFYFTIPQHSFVKLRSDDDILIPSNRFENLFWFIQISDIHISIHHDPNRVTDLKDFLQTSVNVINPSFILATGDLIDAKSKDGLSTQADLEEWRTYYSILHDTNIEAKIPWLDLRGNHDCFDVKHRNHESNGFRMYSAMGKKYNLGSYKYVHYTDFGTYSFIGIDACPKLGLKRPFNFFGVLTDRDVAELRLMARSTVGHNFTIWFSHYPTTTLAVNYHTALRPAIETTNTLAYLCGHLHHLGGLSYTMYTRQPEGHMELELADWKVNRMYRIMAIDYDLASFIDAHYLKWPVILVTNPKESSLSAPIVEPLIRIKFSTHIRVLIFSPYFIESVLARIDGKRLKYYGRHIKGPLFAIPWNPNHYAQGSHKLQVEVTSLGKTTIVSSSFSMDEQIPLYSIISNYILFSHLPSLVFYLFCILWVSFIILLVILLFSPKEIESNFPCLYWTRSIKQYPKVSITWLIANIYMVVGPWCVGIVNSHFSHSIVYLSGIYLQSGFIPLYYMYGIALEQLLTFNIPCTIFLIMVSWNRKVPTNYRLFYYIIFFTLIFNHIRRCYQFFRWFGWMGVLLNPSTTWILLIYLYLYFLILNIRKIHIL